MCRSMCKWRLSRESCHNDACHNSWQISHQMSLKSLYEWYLLQMRFGTTRDVSHDSWQKSHLKCHSCDWYVFHVRFVTNCDMIHGSWQISPETSNITHILTTHVTNDYHHMDEWFVSRIWIWKDLQSSGGTERPIGCLSLQVIFRKRAANYRAPLRKTTYQDNASYDSTPPCSD